MKIVEKKKAVYYLRVSTEEQASEAYGLESQLAAIQQFCREREWELGEGFVDRGISGWKDVERPGFQRMIHYLRTNRDTNLVFFDYSRFGRKTLTALTAFQLLDSLGVYSVAVRHPEIDCRTPAGRKARRDALSDAENFSDQHSVDTTARMKAAFEDGRWCRPAPLGYRTVGAKRKGYSNLVPVEEEAKFVRRAFEMMSSGSHTAADVLRTLTAEGFRSKKGQPKRLGEFLDLLRNKVYIGKMQSKKWGTVDGRHEPIVDQRVFDNVQLVLTGKRPVLAPYTMNREDLPLRRFLHCNDCGKPLTGGNSRGGNGKTHSYYFCHRCRPSRSVKAEKAEGEFVALLNALSVSAKFVDEFVSVVKEEWNQRTGDTTATAKRLRRQIDERKEMHTKLVDEYLLGKAGIKEVFPMMSQRFLDEIAELEGQVRS